MQHYSNKGVPTLLTTDASDTALGAVLEQKTDCVWKPLAFFSRQLRKPKRNYAAFDRELLGIHLAIKQFRYFLEGRTFIIYMDHKPVPPALHKISEAVSGRQARQLAAISEATTDVQHVSGKDNIVADALSRVEPAWDDPNHMLNEDLVDDTHGFLCFAIQQGMGYQGLANDQTLDQDVQDYRTAISNLDQADVSFANNNIQQVRLENK